MQEIRRLARNVQYRRPGRFAGDDYHRGTRDGLPRDRDNLFEQSLTGEHSDDLDIMRYRRQRGLAQLALRGVVPGKQGKGTWNRDPQLLRRVQRTERHQIIVKDGGSRWLLVPDQGADAAPAGFAGVVTVLLDRFDTKTCAFVEEDVAPDLAMQQIGGAADVSNPDMAESGKIFDGIAHGHIVIGPYGSKARSCRGRANDNRGQAKRVDQLGSRVVDSEVDKNDAAHFAVGAPSAVRLRLRFRIWKHIQENRISCRSHGPLHARNELMEIRLCAHDFRRPHEGETDWSQRGVVSHGGLLSVGQLQRRCRTHPPRRNQSNGSARFLHGRRGAPTALPYASDPIGRSSDGPS